MFRASTGMDASALQSATGLSVDNAQAVGALSDAAVSEEDIRAGKFDRAEIRQWLVDWERPELRVLLFRGQFGEIRRTDGAFEVELRGLAEALSAPVGRSVLRTCDRVLGDAKCGFDPSQPGFSGEGELADGGSPGVLVANGLAGFADGWFTAGRPHLAVGRERRRERHGEGGQARCGGLRRVTLWQRPGRSAAVGDRFRVVAGCDKRADTCREKFNNFLNFRGFPHLPGDDWVTAYPKDGAVHDGASLQRS